MKIKRSKLITKALVWFSCEVFFNIIGIDTLADYGEFLLLQQEIVSYKYPLAIALVD